MSKITFSENAWEEYLSWQATDKQILKKINKLLKEIQRTPFSGEGKPEPLKWSPDRWSRRINGKDRLVHEVVNDNTNVIQCKGHYKDK